MKDIIYRNLNGEGVRVILISVIIPVFNKESYIYQCVSSVINQSYTKIEIILINDGSTDDSIKNIEGLIKNDSRIRYFNQKNSGVAVARNRGLEYAKGDYIFLLDADDYLVKDAFTLFLKRNKNINADIIVGNYYTKVGGDIFEKSRYKSSTFKDNDLNKFSVMVDMFIENGRAMAMAGNKMYKRSFIEKRHIRFERNIIAEDRLFNLKCYVNAPTILLLSEYTYVYNILDNSRSKKFNSDYKEETINLFFSLHDYLEKENKKTKYRDLLQLVLSFDIYIIVNYTFNNANKPYRETLKVINSLRNDQLIFNTINNMFKNNNIKYSKENRFSNHMFIESFLFAHTPRMILLYKTLVKLIRGTKKIIPMHLGVRKNKLK